MGKIVPLLLLVVGLGAGVGAGIVLKPHEEVAAANPCGEAEAHAPPEMNVSTEPVALKRDYVKLNNQFVIPVVKDSKIKSLVVLSLSMEIAPGNSEAVYQREPKLRDAFLRAMFDHANSGGFDGEFTANGNMAPLRAELLRAAQAVVGGEVVSDVLITDIVRQDNS